MKPSHEPKAPQVSRRALLLIGLAAVCGAGVAVAALLWDQRHPQATGPLVTVYKHPECRCCGKWIEHLQDHGFAVQARFELKQSERQTSLGVPTELRACHTAVVAGYVVEGHVPAEDVKRLLRERPKARGIAVPGMPIGSPGMEQGDRIDPYDVLLFDEKGTTTTFAHHGSEQQ